MKKSLVSVVIPTLNSEKIISECLESIKKQTYPNIEIIVVDGHSSDRTPEIAKKYGARVYIYGPKQSKAFGKVFGAPYQRNYGVNKAKGKYIYYVDSDMRLTSKVVEECVHLIEKKKADSVVVPESSYGEGFWAQCRVLERACYCQDNLVEAARFIRKDIWDKLEGLDVSLGGGDDWDFQQRLNRNGYRTLRCKNDTKHYEGRLSLKKQIRKKFIYGKTVDKYFKKYQKDPVMLIKQYSLLRPAYFRSWKMLIKNPIYTIGMVFMKTMEYFAAFSGLCYAKFIEGEWRR